MPTDQPYESEQEALRSYVAQKLRAGVSPVQLQSELNRYHVPDSYAQALIHQVYDELLTEARGFSIEAPPPESPKETLAAMSHEELVDYLSMQFSSGYDVGMISQQLLDYGYSQEETAKLLSEVGIAVEPVPEKPRSTLPSTWQGKGEIRSLYERIPAPSANTSGWLSVEQRALLLKGLLRSAWLLVVVLAVSAVGFFILPWVAFIPVISIALISAVVLVFDLLMHLIDLFPGRVRTVRTFLRWPAHIAVEDKTVHTVSMTGRRRRYRLWTQDLYLLIGRWGMEWPYLVYYSPLTRWVWHIEPEVEDESGRRF